MPISKQRLAQAMKDWKPQLAQTLAQEKIDKKGLTNKRKIAIANTKGKHQANKVLRSLDKGYKF
jgi:hypothetical protein